MNIKPKRLRAIAKIARRCHTKKEMSALLKADELAECVRIKAIQRERWNARETAVIGGCRYGSGGGYGLQEHYLKPQKLHQYEREGIRRSAWKTTRRWPMAQIFYGDFTERIAGKIKEGWTYDAHGKTHHLSVHHAQTVKVECKRPACRYTVMGTRLHFPLLTHEAVWIGGLLTIRAKADAHLAWGAKEHVA